MSVNACCNFTVEPGTGSAPNIILFVGTEVNTSTIFSETTPYKAILTDALDMLSLRSVEQMNQGVLRNLSESVLRPDVGCGDSAMPLTGAYEGWTDVEVLRPQLKPLFF